MITHHTKVFVLFGEEEVFAGGGEVAILEATADLVVGEGVVFEAVEGVVVVYIVNKIEKECYYFGRRTLSFRICSMCSPFSSTVNFNAAFITIWFSTFNAH